MIGQDHMTYLHIHFLQVYDWLGSINKNMIGQDHMTYLQFIFYKYMIGWDHFAYLHIHLSL